MFTFGVSCWLVVVVSIECVYCTRVDTSRSNLASGGRGWPDRLPFLTAPPMHTRQPPAVKRVWRAVGLYVLMWSVQLLLANVEHAPAKVTPPTRGGR